MAHMEEMLYCWMGGCDKGSRGVKAHGFGASTNTLRHVIISIPAMRLSGPRTVETEVGQSLRQSRPT